MVDLGFRSIRVISANYQFLLEAGKKRIKKKEDGVRLMETSRNHDHRSVRFMETSRNQKFV